jgi:hypothetical protein
MTSSRGKNDEPEETAGATGKPSGPGSHFQSAKDTSGLSSTTTGAGSSPETGGDQHVDTVDRDTVGTSTDQPGTAIGQTSTYSSTPLAKGDPTSSVIDPESKDPMTYQKPERASYGASGVPEGSATVAASKAFGKTSGRCNICIHDYSSSLSDWCAQKTCLDRIRPRRSPHPPLSLLGWLVQLQLLQLQEPQVLRRATPPPTTLGPHPPHSRRQPVLVSGSRITAKQNSQEASTLQVLVEDMVLSQAWLAESWVPSALEVLLELELQRASLDTKTLPSLTLQISPPQLLESLPRTSHSTQALPHRITGRRAFPPLPIPQGLDQQGLSRRQWAELGRMSRLR